MISCKKKRFQMAKANMMEDRMCSGGNASVSGGEMKNIVKRGVLLSGHGQQLR